MYHTISLATADRRRSLVFYRRGLGLEASARSPTTAFPSRSSSVSRRA
jgi:catechol 2,3-dioxygenase-like lactoylglutathione lyase family enzyme